MKKDTKYILFSATTRSLLRLPERVLTRPFQGGELHGSG